MAKSEAEMPRRRREHERMGRHSNRLDFKLQESKKRMYQRAAEITGESLTAFAVSAMDARAEAVIREHDTMLLTPEESVTFIDLMCAPLAPNAQLAVRLAEYDAYFGKDT
jgi:uncharacterized protein (DUF1778 family)